MKVLIVSDVFPPECGGVGWGAYYLAKSLLKSGHEVEVVTVFGKQDLVDGIRVHRCPPSGSKEFAYRRLRKFLIGLLKERKFDILHAHHVIAARASAGLNIPVAVTVNDYWPVCYKGTLFNSALKTHYSTLTFTECLKSVWYENNWKIKALSPFIVPYMLWRTRSSLSALRKADAISFLSKDNQKKMGGLVKDIPQNITYHICATEIDADKIPLKKFNRPTVVFVGKFNVNKGAMLAVQIARIIPEIDLVMVGGTKTQLQKAEPIPENVKIISYIPNNEVFSYMKSAVAFIAPALWHEPFGRIVVEAMAVGAVPIVSDRGGMSSDIVTDSKSGLIVDPPAAENFAKAIRKIISDKELSAKLSKGALAEFKEKFNESAVTAQYLQLYDNAIMHFNAKKSRNSKE